MFQHHDDEMLKSLLVFHTSVAEDKEARPEDIREAHIRICEIQSEQRFRRIAKAKAHKEAMKLAQRKFLLSKFGKREGGDSEQPHADPNQMKFDI